MASVTTPLQVKDVFSDKVDHCVKSGSVSATGPRCPSTSTSSKGNAGSLNCMVARVKDRIMRGEQMGKENGKSR